MLTKYKITWEFYNTYKEFKNSKNRFKRWFKDFIDKYKLKIYIICIYEWIMINFKYENKDIIYLLIC